MHVLNFLYVGFLCWLVNLLKMTSRGRDSLLNVCLCKHMIFQSGPNRVEFVKGTLTSCLILSSVIKDQTGSTFQFTHILYRLYGRWRYNENDMGHPNNCLSQLFEEDECVYINGNYFCFYEFTATVFYEQFLSSMITLPIYYPIKNNNLWDFKISSNKAAAFIENNKAIQ